MSNMIRRILLTTRNSQRKEVKFAYRFPVYFQLVD